MENQNREIKILSKEEYLYKLKVGNMDVDIKYSQNNKSFSECMLNILKLKMK